MEACPSTSSGKPCQNCEGCYRSKGGDQLHIIAHDFGMRYSTSKCPRTFVHVVYKVAWEIVKQFVIYSFQKVQIWFATVTQLIQNGACNVKLAGSIPAGATHSMHTLL